MKLGQKITAFFLILLTIGSFGYKDYILINFSLHQDEIAAEHCVNKDKPELHCNGKCYLSKELKLIDDDSKEDVKNTQLINIDSSWFVSVQYFNTYQPSNSLEQKEFSDTYLDNYLNQYYPYIFQPPRC